MSNNELIVNSLYISTILHFESNSAIINLGAETWLLRPIEQIIAKTWNVITF